MSMTDDLLRRALALNDDGFEGVDDDLPDTAFARAYAAAEERQAALDAEAEAERRERESLDAELKVYDPMPYAEAEPIDLKMYEGTSIGAMYGMPGPDLEPLLEGWSLRPRSVYE